MLADEDELYASKKKKNKQPLTAAQIGEGWKQKLATILGAITAPGATSPTLLADIRQSIPSVRKGADMRDAFSRARGDSSAFNFFLAYGLNILAEAG